METVRVFIGTDADIHKKAEQVIEYSIRTNTSVPVDIRFIRPGWKSGCTGFTTHRYLVPALCQHKGFAIYLDVDMIVFGDLAELWNYRRRGFWVVPKGSGDEVSVIDCAAFRFPSESELMRQGAKFQCEQRIGARYLRIIPESWNVEDNVAADMKLLHFTNMATQPWQPSPAIEYQQHESEPASKLFFEYWEKAKQCA